MFEFEEYDTESLEMDMLLHKNHDKCNVMQIIKDGFNFDLIYDYFYDQKRMLFINVV